MARVTPSSAPNGAELIEFLRTHKPDPEFATDVGRVRALLTGRHPWRD